jgi:hypothetical protein
MSSSDRRPYLTATTLDQTLLDNCQDNLSIDLRLIVEIDAPDGSKIYASDRNIYVGDIFYEALVTFPLIERTVGEWLSSQVEFSVIELDLSNTDGRFNRFLPAGADFTSWIGSQVEVKLGLREAESTFFRIFSGVVTDVGGFKRDLKQIRLIARDKYDELSKEFPTAVLEEVTYPDIDLDLVGTAIPVIYGDWTTAITDNTALLPAYPVNTGDFTVRIDERACTFDTLSPLTCTLEGHGFSINDEVIFSTSDTLPPPLAPATKYYVHSVLDADNFTLKTSLGGSQIVGSAGQTGDHNCQFDGAPNNVAFVVSINANRSFLTNSVYVRRNSQAYRLDTSDITNVSVDNNTFEIIQSNVTTIPDDTGTDQPYLFDKSDQYFVRVEGADISAGLHDNIVAQARDILEIYGGLSASDFDASWTTFQNKTTPAESNIADIKSRIWLNEPTSVIEYALSLLEQVRLEAFINRDLKLEVLSIHLDDFEGSPSYTVQNWDVKKESFVPQSDERNNFNRARADYNFIPEISGNLNTTPVYKNTAAIAQVGRDISKKLVYPNLYILSQVETQLQETLKLSSAYAEMIEVTLTWRSLLLDIGQFVGVNVNIAAADFTNVPCMVRSVGYDPEGLGIPVKLWSFQMVPFPGYSPGYAGTVGGSSATIVKE